MSARDYTEEDIQELTDRVFLLREHLEAGKLKFKNQELADGFRQSYEAIRIRPDGKVDPTSVDGRIRTLTLAICSMRQREDAKQSLSLMEVQERYFNYLFREFGWLYEQMEKSGASPQHVAAVTSRHEDMIQALRDGLPAVVDDLREFWEAVGETVGYHLQDSQNLKAVFAGDIFPAYWENAVSTAGLYVDTIILPCPITRLGAIIKTNLTKELIEIVIKHILTAMSYKDIALADVSPPIAIIVPNPDDSDDSKRQKLIERATPAICAHANYLFDRKFESIAALQEFCYDLKSIDQVVRELKRPERLIFNIDWGNNPVQQLSMSIKEDRLTPGTKIQNAGSHVLMSCIGRMPQALAAQLTSQYFGGSPFINAESSWLFYTWLLEYQATPRNDDLSNRQSMHVVRALASETNNNLEWLGQVPPKTVIDIRKRGLANELRELLGEGVSNLVKINPDNYFRTADQVVENLDSAFRKHQQDLREAKKKKLKIYGIDVGGCLATGGIAVAAAMTSHPVISAISAGLSVVGTPTFKDIKTKFKELSAEEKARKESPTGLLFSHIKSK